MLLIYIGYLYSLSYFKLTFIHGIKPHYQTEKGGLTCTIRTDNTYNTIRRKHEIKIIKE